MLSGTLVLQEGKELVFWVYLEYEQKAIFIKVFSSKKPVCFLASVLL